MIDDKLTGFEELLAEEKEAGELNYEVPPINEVCALDLVREAFEELSQRSDLAEQLGRMNSLTRQLGY